MNFFIKSFLKCDITTVIDFDKIVCVLFFFLYRFCLFFSEVRIERRESRVDEEVYSTGCDFLSEIMAPERSCWQTPLVQACKKRKKKKKSL